MVESMKLKEVLLLATKKIYSTEKTLITKLRKTEKYKHLKYIIHRIYIVFDFLPFIRTVSPHLMSLIGSLMLRK